MINKVNRVQHGLPGLKSVALDDTQVGRGLVGMVNYLDEIFKNT